MLCWFVLYTRPKSEKKAAQWLSEAGYEVYCPVAKVIKQWSDRKKKVSEPLFKSYIFIRIEEHLREDAFACPSVVRYLFWLGKPAVVRDIEIEAIKDFISNHGSANIQLAALASGTKVKIVSGPLKDSVAVVKRMKRNHVVLQIESIGMQLQAEVHRSMVE